MRDVGGTAEPLSAPILKTGLGTVGIALLGLILKVETDISTLQTQQFEYTRIADRDRLTVDKLREQQGINVVTIAELRLAVETLTDRLNKLSVDYHAR